MLRKNKNRNKTYKTLNTSKQDKQTSEHNTFPFPHRHFPTCPVDAKYYVGRGILSGQKSEILSHCLAKADEIHRLRDVVAEPGRRALLRHGRHDIS